LIARPALLPSLLYWAGAVLVVLSGIIHLHLWSTGYRHVPTIGPLFLLQGLLALVLAVAVATSRQAVVALATALFMGGTVAGLIITVEIGLFGFQDSWQATDAAASLVVEIIALVVLLAGAGAASLQGRQLQHQTFRKRKTPPTRL
jgi:hypothetical protein